MMWCWTASCSRNKVLSHKTTRQRKKDFSFYWIKRCHVHTGNSSVKYCIDMAMGHLQYTCHTSMCTVREPQQIHQNNTRSKVQLKCSMVGLKESGACSCGSVSAAHCSMEGLVLPVDFASVRQINLAVTASLLVLVLWGPPWSLSLLQIMCAGLLFVLHVVVMWLRRN